MAIQSLGEKPRGSCFPHAARTGKEIRMMQPPVLDSVSQSARNWFLAGDFVESLRTPLAGDYLIGHELSLIALISLLKL